MKEYMIVERRLIKKLKLTMHLLVELIKYELLSAGSGYQVKDDLRIDKF